MTRSRLAVLLAAAAIAPALSGCGLHDPYNDPDPAAAETTRHAATPTAADGPAATSTLPADPQEAARQYAELFGNWTAETLGEQAGKMAERAVGSARDDALGTAASAFHTEPGTSSQSRVDAVTIRGEGDKRTALVVSYDRTRAGAHEGMEAGPPQEGWHLTVGTLIRQPDGGWAVSSWKPKI